MNAQTNVNNSGQKIRTVDITVTAAMAALVFLGTYIFKIPTISGYVHLGDCMIILTVALFGMKKGAVAGAIGGGLSDFIGGYFYWVVPTLLIKCMWALVMGLIMHKIQKRSLSDRCSIRRCPSHYCLYAGKSSPVWRTYSYY